MVSDHKKNDIVKQEVFLTEGYSDEYLQKILELEKACFPEDWQYDDSSKYFREILSNPQNLNIFLKESDEIVGYGLIVPLKDEINELKKHDSEIFCDEGEFYLETIEILPNHQGHGGATKILLAACHEAKKRGIKKISAHARVNNNFNIKIKKIFKNNILITRKINHWYFAGGEPYEFISWKLI